MICYSRQKTYGTGGKAEGLYRLQDLGLPVPDFLVITYENFKETISLKQKDGDAKKVSEALLNYKLPSADLEKIQQILVQWDFPKNPVVVRSSVLDEDGSKNAFPGVMDSFLNISTFKDLEEAIGKCAASAWSPRAMAYRKQHELGLEPKPAVIIQQQIDPDASGVVFTTFPEYPQEMAIHAVYGFGEGLMQGTAEGDEFYFLKSNGNLHRQNIATKATALRRSVAAGLQPQALELEEQESPCMEILVLEKLYSLAQAAERSVGYPLDIEFAVKGDELYFLQARPVTQEIPEIVVFDNSNIQESYCGVTTPLTFHFASRAYKTVYRQTMEVLGIPAEEIGRHDKVVSNLLGLVKGRIYYNINNWYRGLQLLPSFKQNKKDMELMMGLQEPVDFIEDVERSLVQKMRLLPKLAVTYFKLWRKFKKLPKLVPLFQQNFQKHYSAFYKEEQQICDAEAFLKKKNYLDDNLLNSWTVPIINDFNVMMVNGSVMRKLKKAGFEEPEEFLGRFLAGDPEIESTQPTIAMMELAEIAHTHPDLKSLILEMPAELHSEVEKRHPNFYKEVTSFIHQYGDRTVGELKLETTTMRVEPQIFYKYLRNFLSGVKIEKINLKPVSEKAKAELESALQNQSIFFKRKVKKELHKLRLAIRYRENMRLERTRLFGMYRSTYRAFGRNLAEKAKLKSVEDVFFLAEEELLNFEKLHNPISIVSERKREFERYKKEDVPSRIVVPSPPMEQQQEEEKPGFLKGQGCYPGQVSGEIIVIKDPADNLDVNNKIICALRTDPGWAALFPTCKGVLIEKGSSLSHSVIILRELGIPTIINIPNLCKRLASGKHISMDGSTGEIHSA